MREKGVNLLAGMALSYFMHPLSVKELGKDFELTHSLKFGHLSMVYTDPDPEKYLNSYIKTSLYEEVMQERLTRNLGALSRFLEAASFSQGPVLNVTEVARECGVRRMTAHPKFYFFDAGV